MAALTPSPRMQFLDETGKPLIGGRLYTYEAGTTTPLTTYIDSMGEEPNENPITLDGRGQAAIWLNFDAYKFILYDANGVLQYSEDNIIAYVAERTYTMVDSTFDSNKGTIFLCTMLADMEFADGMTDGQSLTLMLTNGNLYIASWPAMIWVSDTGNSAPVLTGADVVVLWKAGGDLYGRYIGSYI